MIVEDDKISLPDYLVKEKIRKFRICGEPLRKKYWIAYQMCGRKGRFGKVSDGFAEQVAEIIAEKADLYAIGGLNLKEKYENSPVMAK